MAADEGNEEDAEAVIYKGTVKKVSAKDPNKFVVECPEAFEAYGVQVLLPASKKPEGVKLGDPITFTTHPSKPLVTWAKKAKQDKKRKAEELEAEDEIAAEEVYAGKVVKRSEKQPSLYIVDCPVVTEWYGVEARMPEKLWPEGLKMGGEINFGVKETPSGKPLVSWAELVPKKEKESKAKKPEETETPVYTPGWTAVVEMRDAESAIEAWAMDGKEFNGKLLAVVHHPTTEDGLKFKVSGIPVNTEWMDLKRHFEAAGKVGHVKLNSPFAVGEVTFDDPDTAANAVNQLWGTFCQGAELRCEIDSRCEEGNKIRVMRLPPGFSSSALMEHFSAVGEVAGCMVRDIIPS